MRIFIHELKKIWNWKVLFAIAAFAVLTWFAFLADGIDTYNSLKSHGYYGSYQTEMFNLYGDSLEPDELTDFDIPGRFAEIFAEANAIIANEPLFAKYGITNFDEFIEWHESESYWVTVNYSILDATGELTPENQERMDMQNALGGGKTLGEYYASPLTRLDCLRALEERYANHDYHRTYFVELQTRPVVVRAGTKILERDNNSLIPYHLPDVFSLCAAITAVFAVVAVIILITPPLIIDRSRKVTFLQYSATAGRRILRIQFLAAIVSAFVLSASLICLLLAPLVVSAAEYLNTSIFHGNVTFVWLYDITFGEFAFILVGMIILLCVCTACTAFILARFSNNIVTVMVKAVAAGAALATAAALAVNMALSDWNFIFNFVFRGRVDMPEVMVCVAVSIVGALATAFVVKREKRVDVM